MAQKLSFCNICKIINKMLTTVDDSVFSQQSLSYEGKCIQKNEKWNSRNENLLRKCRCMWVCRLEVANRDRRSVEPDTFWLLAMQPSFGIVILIQHSVYRSLSCIRTLFFCGWTASVCIENLDDVEFLLVLDFVVVGTKRQAACQRLIFVISVLPFSPLIRHFKAYFSLYRRMKKEDTIWH